jgi:hypothetical protein
MPNVHKMYQHLPLQGPPKFAQIWIFGLKTNRLATLNPIIIYALSQLQRGTLAQLKLAIDGQVKLSSQLYGGNN